eukprot:INCI19282.1.p1 GENE.INCI19282.1~~INCI19282.1.p1  ORF type:complete len:1068 (-),score=127.26 INCI19282.1:123-3326(-)
MSGQSVCSFVLVCVQLWTLNAVVGGSVNTDTGSSAQNVGVPLAPNRLRIDHASDGTRGVAQQQPRLSWALSHTGRSQYPTAYEVIVQRYLPNGTGVLVWAANVTVSKNESLGQPVPYNADGSGVALVSDADYDWKVRWFDAQGRSSPWSLPSHFSTALMQEEDWQGAEWIGMDGPENSAPFVDADADNRFRTEFVLNGPNSSTGLPARCSLMISGLGYYRAFIEGNVLDDHELGESTQFQRRIPYDNVNCTHALAAVLAASNGSDVSTLPVALGIELGRGWYGEQQITALGNIPSGPRMIRCLLTVLYQDGSIQYVKSDPRSAAWKRGPGPVVWDQLHLGIVYDARRESPTWNFAGFNDSTWQLISEPLNLSSVTSNVGYGRLHGARMVTRLQPAVRKVHSFPPVKISSPADSTYVVDLGQNIAGRCQFALSPKAGSGGVNVTFLHAERLNSNGTITHDIQPLTAGAFEQTVLILPDDPVPSTVTFEPRFVSYGFRYVQLQGPLATPPSIDNVTCWWIHTDLQQTGDFAFATPARETALEIALQRNYDSTLNSARANFISFPTDCPHRERRGWLGDAGASAATFSYAYDMAASYTKWLDDIDDTTALSFSNGNIGSISPQYNHFCSGPANPPSSSGMDAPAWSAAFVLVWDLTWRLYGDLDLASVHYVRAKAYVDFLGRSWNATQRVLPVDWGGNLLGDWCAALGVNGTGDPGPFENAYSPRHASGISNTFYFIATHEAMLRAQAALGRPAAEMEPVRQRLNAAREGFNDKFFDAGRKIYRDLEVQAKALAYGPEVLQTALSLALELGLPAALNATEAVQNALLRDVAARDSRMTSGLIGTRYIFSALASIPGSSGVDKALDVLSGTSSPSYGYMFAQGPGNTLWESPDGNASWHRPRGSLNHIMLGGHAGPFFFENLGGISPWEWMDQMEQQPQLGWEGFDVFPTLTSRLSGFRATIEAGRGTIESSWRWAGDTLVQSFASSFPCFDLNVTVPIASRAHVYFSNTSTIQESGVTVWQNGSLVPNAAPGIVEGTAVPAINGVFLEVVSGSFMFSAAGPSQLRSAVSL